MKKLIVLIFLMMMSLKGFSQNAIDTTSIQLKKPIARLVIKDLIRGDGANEELVLNKQKINLLENKISLKDSVIVSLESQVGNFDFIILNKTEQLAISQELSKRLEKDLKKQKFKTKLMGGAGILIAVAAAVLVN